MGGIVVLGVLGWWVCLLCPGHLSLRALPPWWGNVVGEEVPGFRSLPCRSESCSLEGKDQLQLLQTPWQESASSGADPAPALHPPLGLAEGHTLTPPP